MNFADFCERVFGEKLLPWHKIYLNKMAEVFANGMESKVVFIPQRCGKTTMVALSPTLYDIWKEYNKLKPIPEGYTYIRCDRYTPEEFLEKYSGINQRDICEQYMKDNPKELYNTDDEIAIHNIHKERAVPGLLHGRNTFTTKKTWYTDR